MHPDKVDTVSATKGTDNYGRAQSPTQSPPVAKLMTHADEQMFEIDAWRHLDHAVAEFRLMPTDFNSRMIGLLSEQYRDAWMRGRRRVMD